MPGAKQLTEDELNQILLNHVGERDVYQAVSRIRDLERKNEQLSEQFRKTQNLNDQLMKEVVNPIRDLHRKLEVKAISEKSYLDGVRYYTSPH